MNYGVSEETLSHTHNGGHISHQFPFESVAIATTLTLDVIVLPPHRNRLHLLSSLERRSGHTDCPQLLSYQRLLHIYCLSDTILFLCVYKRHLFDILSGEDRSCLSPRAFSAEITWKLPCQCIYSWWHWFGALCHKRRLSKQAIAADSHYYARESVAIFVRYYYQTDRSIDWLLAPRSGANRNANYQLISILSFPRVARSLKL